MDALEAARDHGLDAEQERALGRPVARRPRAVLLAAEDHRGHAVGDVLHGCVVDRHFFALVAGEAAFLAAHHLVLDAHVGKGAAHHHLVVAAAGAVAVEVAHRDVVLLQVVARRGGRLDAAGRRDVVGGHRVAEHAEDLRAGDGLDLGRLHGEVGEERRLGNVGRLRPVVHLARGRRHLLPEHVVLAEVLVQAAEGRRVHGEFHQGGDFVVGRPDMADVHVLAILRLADRLGAEVLEHRAGDRVGHHQRGRGEEVGADVGVDARLEVAVAREHGRADQVVLDDGFLDRLRQRAGVADAGGAAVAGRVEAKLLEVGQEPRLGQVLGHHARPWGERGLDVRLDRQAQFHGLLGEQARGQQHAGVGGVGAGGDGGDQHVARADFGAVIGLDALAEVRGRLGEAVFRHRLGEQAGEGALHVLEADAVLRALGAGQGWHHRGQVQFHGLRVIDAAGLGHAVQALRLEVGLERLDLGIGAAGALEVVDGLVVDREEAHGGAVFRGHVGDRRAVGQGQRRGAFAEELDELAHHLGLAQHLGDGEHQVGGGDRLVEFALQVNADHVRGQEVHGLAQHAGLGLDAAHAPADHADAVDHGGVAIGAHQCVRVIDAVLAVHAAGEVLQVHLVHDADAWGHDLEGVEGLHAPFHELVALLVAGELQLHVQVQRLAVAVVVDLHRMVDDQVHGHQRLDGLGVLAHLLGDVAHGGEIREQRHAGEVLQHDTGEHERDLVGARGVGLPVGQLLDVLFGHLLAVAVPQHRLEHDANRHRQAGDLSAEGFFECRQGIELAGFPGGEFQVLEGVVQVMRH